MKMNFKKVAVIALAGALAAGSAFSAAAASIEQGQWCTGSGEHAGDWWFKLSADGSKFLANTWYWIKDTDGVIRCYYFDANGFMVKNMTMEDGTVDADGHYVVNGAVVTADENQAYATATNLDAVVAAQAAPVTVIANGAAASTGKLSAAVVGNPEAAGATSVMTIKSKSGKAVGGGYKNPIKSSGQGDSPVNATFTLDYENAAVNGTVVSNNWANYTMNLGTTVHSENTGSGTDWYVESGDAELINTYIALDKYVPGNTSLDAFIASYLADARGYKGGALDGTVTLGAYNFVRLTKVVKTPYGDEHNYTYIRQIEGTNFAQILTVETGGGANDFMSALQTIARVR